VPQIRRVAELLYCGVAMLSICFGSPRENAFNLFFLKDLLSGVASKSPHVLRGSGTQAGGHTGATQNWHKGTL
jgi:hypothetical protein